MRLIATHNLVAQLQDSLDLKRLTYNYPELVRGLPQSHADGLTLRALRIERHDIAGEVLGAGSYDEIFIPVRFELSWIYIYPRTAIKKKLPEEVLQERVRCECRNRRSTLKRTTFPPKYWDRVRVAFKQFGAREVQLNDGTPAEILVVDCEIPLAKVFTLGPRLEIDLLKRIVNRFKLSLSQRKVNSTQRYYRSVKLVVEDWLHSGETKESWKMDVKADRESLWMRRGEEFEALPFEYFEVARKVPKRIVIAKSPNYTVIVRKGVWPTNGDGQNRVIEHLAPMVPRIVEWSKEIVPLEQERIFL